MSGLHESIAAAKAEVRALKQTAPQMFPEYLTMFHAQREFEAAKQRLNRAQAAWDALGATPPAGEQP